MAASCITMGNIFGTKDQDLAGSESEISSVNSDWSDIQAIASQLGILNLDELYTERFKVDRTKLSNMITDLNPDGTNGAEDFFNLVMKETATHVSWPCRLKLGAKTKKDPHVRIIGKKINVLKAKERIMSRLVSRGNRVIMKIDISYTDHSFIIGRGGNNIRRIMEDTQTHIHFPDSNRSNPTEKSNQVSICGTMEGTEKARALVRMFAPVLYSFEMPVTSPGEPVPDNNTPFIVNVEKSFKVQVIFSSRQKLHSSLVLVKGCEIDVDKVKEATKRLIDFICGNMADQTSVQMQIDISTQHHPIVLGRGSANLSDIMKKTGTKIMFPDANDINIKPLKRSQVTITGGIDGVYLARQQLIGSLPVALIFDYPESSIEPEIINKIMYTHDVFVAVRQKSRQSTLCIVVKGIEKYITKIYEARHQMLNLKSRAIVAEIPKTYFLPNEGTEPSRKNSLASMLQFDTSPPFSPFTPLSAWNGVGAPNQMPSHFSMGFDLGQRFSHLNISNSNSMPDISDTKRMTLNPGAKPSNMLANSFSPQNDLAHSSGYQSLNYSVSSLENPQHMTSDLDENFNIKVPQRKLSVDENAFKSSNGSTHNTNNTSNTSSSSFFNFDPRIIDGINAISMGMSNDMLRTPKPYWQGLGLSKTSPAPLADLADLEKQMNVAKFNMSTQLLPDSTSSRHREQSARYNDVASILHSIGLQHHIELFINAEIDMTVFPTLTDDDLLNLGIRTFGARRRIMMAIHDVAMRQNVEPPLMFSGSAAPGAERRGSTGHI